MNDHQSDWSLQTRVVHAGERAPAPESTPTATPIYTSATYLHPDLAALDTALETGNGYVYTRYGNPTVAALEEAMTVVERGAGATAFASGMAALYAALLAAGTPRGATAPAPRAILAARDMYGATTLLLQEFFAARGTQIATCDMCDLNAVDAALEANRPDVLLVEQLSNPLLRVVDIQALAQRARVADARLVVDSTIVTPVLQQPLTLGADLVVHSATKYLGGHGDVAGGIVVTRTGLVRDTLRRQARLLGASLGPFEAYQILRGMKTLALRMRQQCRSAAEIATWLTTHPAVATVHYPGLACHPQHPLATEMFGKLFGALVTFELRGASREALHRFFNALRLILPATTLGDVYTLASAPSMASHRELTPEQRAERGIGDGMIRLSVGIEETADIIADLRQALDRLIDG
ncbi:MAG: trans-sulfuration enzyme family protein [Roseiflexus sp.]